MVTAVAAGGDRRDGRRAEGGERDEAGKVHDACRGGRERVSSEGVKPVGHEV